VIALATLSGPVPRVGVVAVAALVAIVLLVGVPRIRALAMLAALVLTPALLLAAIWHSSQLGFVHRHPLYAVVGGLLALVVLAAVAFGMRRKPQAFPLLAVLALPFRIPISSGGNTSNLLVPLYLVVGAGALAWIVPALIGSDAARRPPGDPGETRARPPDPPHARQPRRPTAARLGRPAARAVRGPVRPAGDLLDLARLAQRV